MANFATHIAVGTLVSGTLATVTLAANVISGESLVAVTMAGMLGSVLPDIDLKDSRPSQIMFSGLALFFSFVALFSFAERLSISEMMIVWLGTFLAIRFGAQALFHRFAHHRGIWHSLLAGGFFWCLTAVIYKHLLGFYDGVAWLAGAFLFVGFLSHLILDEIYSVDVLDRRIKASFGTAFKLFDLRHPVASAAMGLAALGAFYIAPATEPFRSVLYSQDMWAGLKSRMLPREKWFHDLLPAAETAWHGAPPQALATGSVGSPAETGTSGTK